MRGILSKADSWKPDLIVVGSHGTSAIGRIFMGSISHSVLTHAPCSVRIGRGEATKTQSPPRILIGVDGSAEAAHAVRVVANRTWPAETEARVIAVIDSTMRTAVPVTHAFAMEWMQMPSEDPKIWTRAVGRAVVELKEGGVSATSRVTEGDPKRVILDEAKAWPATCIFVGARGLGRVLRILLGSVSLAVASRATCSVEVVRSPELA
jgi:nucleotide-binding universal stress UspA family protein